MEVQEGTVPTRIGGLEGGRQILLVSGLNGTSKFWDPVRTLLEQSCLVLSYDQPGCGARPDDLGPSTTIDRLALDALGVAERAFGRTPVVVAGHSTGGAIAQAMAAHAPALVQGLVLSGTWLRADTYMHELFSLRKEIIRRAPELDAPVSSLLRLPPARVSSGDFKPEALASQLAETMMRRMDALLAFRGDAIAARITASTLILGARDDLVVPVWHQQHLQEALGHSSLKIFESGGHFFPVEQAQAYCHEVGLWLETIAGSA